MATQRVMERGSTWSTRLIKLTAITVILSVLQTHAAPAAKVITCPLSIRVNGIVHSYSNIEVFDGPPVNLGELTGDEHGHWDLAAIVTVSNPAGFFMVCHYNGTTATTTVHVPRTTAKCEDYGDKAECR